MGDSLRYSPATNLLVSKDFVCIIEVFYPSLQASYFNEADSIPQNYDYK